LIGRPATLGGVVDANDWRRRGQEKHLRGARLAWRRYQAMSAQWEHEHCEFCWAKFLDANYSPAHRVLLESDPEVLAGGYTEAPGGTQPAGEHWICKPCFEDFREEFEWELVPSDPEAWPYARPEPHPRPTQADFDRDAVVRRPGQ
jgi:hypothetical protein